ncbi:MAG: PAS domain-containing protein [Bdellovibrionales bacterium]|nr:PAS domain-containing protein [Bdellovibrionales bacterium]
MPNLKNPELMRSELLKSQKELADQKYALDQSAIVAVTDSRGMITSVNEKFCDISQYRREDLICRDHRILNSGYHGKDFFVSLWKTISGGQVWRGEIRNRAKDGSFYWVDTTIVPFLDENKKPYQYVAIRYDISDRKATEERLEEDHARAMHAEKMASLGILSSGIAHELGNPLAALQGRLEMLFQQLDSNKFDPESAKSSIEKCQQLILRMSKIIRGLRSYSRDGSNDPFSKISFSDLVADVLEFSRERMRKLGIEVTEVGLENDYLVMCRETEIGQVIVNLLNNAADAVRDSEIKKIQVEIKKSDESVQLRVSDSGPGIPKEIIDKIFLPFFTTKPVGSGTGLGLSISSGILSSHGGRLDVESQPGNTVFSVRMPLIQVGSR